METKKVLFIILTLSLFLNVVSAFDDCLNNQVACAYPGTCALYVDTDGDNLCDRSQPDSTQIEITENSVEQTEDLISGQDLKLYTVEEIANLYKINPNEYVIKLSEYYNIKIEKENSFQLLHDNYGIDPSTSKNIALAIKNNEEIVIEPKTTNERIYHLIPILIISLIFYITSHILSKKNKISVSKHRRIWNILLLATFLISGILGILLVIRINFGINFPLPFNILFWHVEFGIAMSIISMFHIAWHWNYFKNIIKK